MFIFVPFAFFRSLAPQPFGTPPRKFFSRPPFTHSLQYFSGTVKNLVQKGSELKGNAVLGQLKTKSPEDKFSLSTITTSPWGDEKKSNRSEP
jgi:hypothetical protein